MKSWLALVLLCASSAALGDDLERARQIHKEAIGIDSHIDTLQWVIYQDADLSKRHSMYHVDFPRLHEGGMLAPYFALYVPTYYAGQGGNGVTSFLVPKSLATVSSSVSASGLAWTQLQTGGVGC